MNTGEFNRELGQRLRALRVSRGLTLGQVQTLSAGRLRVPAMGTWERGERAISVERLAELAAFYHVPPGSLIPGAPS